MTSDLGIWRKKYSCWCLENGANHGGHKDTNNGATEETEVNTWLTQTSMVLVRSAEKGGQKSIYYTKAASVAEGWSVETVEGGRGNQVQ